MLVPDAGVLFSYRDIPSSASGADEGGFDHPIYKRYNVMTAKLSYAHMTEEERAYHESLFSNSSTFEFTHPDRLDASKSVTSVCKRGKRSISWYNATLGTWENFAETIEEC